MAFYSSFQFAPAEWLPFRDQAVLDQVVNADIYAHQGKHFENPDFELKVVFDVHNYFAVELMQRIRDAIDEGTFDEFREKYSGKLEQRA